VKGGPCPSKGQVLFSDQITDPFMDLLMKPLRLSEDIVPIAEFKAHLSEVVRGLRQRRRPVVITQNGKPAAVLLSPEEFDALAHHAGFMDAVQRGLADARAGRLLSDEELGHELDREFGPLGE
jgi:prevent-host-death family protein